VKTLFPAAVVVCLLATSYGIAEDVNPRWDFLRMNLQVFPGTDQIFEADGRLFWRLKANLNKIRAAEKLPQREYPFQVSTDAKGRRSISKTSPANSAVLFLGDSCTFGIPVNDNEAFPARVSQALNIPVINAGVPGYSAFQGRLLLDDFKERPHAIVITFWVNDRTIWDHLSDAEHFELLAADRAGEFSRHRLTRILRRAMPGTRPRLNEDEFAAELTALIQRARTMGAVPLLVIWPTARQMNGEPEDLRQTIIRNVGKQTETTVVDLAPNFASRGGSSLFVDPVHATVRGYQVAADTIAGALRPLVNP
jgi:lysophospholipase L1-like esterase